METWKINLSNLDKNSEKNHDKFQVNKWENGNLFTG